MKQVKKINKEFMTIFGVILIVLLVLMLHIFYEADQQVLLIEQEEWQETAGRCECGARLELFQIIYTKHHVDYYYVCKGDIHHLKKFSHFMPYH